MKIGKDRGGSEAEELERVRAVRSAVGATAGEYGYDLVSFERMLEHRSVDVLQADAGRCAGVTEWLRAAAAAAAHGVPFSAHCGPSIHAHAATVPPNLRHIEWFHDHVRVDRMLFEGVPEPVGGAVRPADDRPGLGLSPRPDAVRRFRAG